MKKFFVLTGLIFLYLIYGLYLNQYDVKILSQDLVADHPPGFFDYRGITDVHTSLSSGSGDINDVIAAAQEAGLDFVSITDLNLFDKPTSLSGYHGNMLVMIDGEYSYLNSRLLNIGATTDRDLHGLGRSQVLFADLLSQRHKDKDRGLLILNHPLENRYRWSGEYPVGLDGIEIINLKDVWQDAWRDNRISFLWSLVIYPFNEKLALLRLFHAPDDEIRIWDETMQKRHFIGIAGADADARLAFSSSLYWKFPSYETLFSLVRDHVLLRSELTGNASSDFKKLVSAIGRGQFYMSLDILGNPKGFNAVIRTQRGKIFPMGSDVKYQPGLALEITLPQKPNVPCDVIVIRNGDRMMVANSRVTRYYLNSPGEYRVLVRVIPTLPIPDGKKWIPWIYTNPFYVK